MLCLAHGHIFVMTTITVTSPRITQLETLPEDVLQCIFKEIHDLTPPEPEFIGSICRRWRAVALEANWLWTNLIFKLPHGQSDSDFSCPRFRLSRSGVSPLDVSKQSRPTACGSISKQSSVFWSRLHIDFDPSGLSTACPLYKLALRFEA